MPAPQQGSVPIADANGNLISTSNPLATNQYVGTAVYATVTLLAATGGNVALPAVAGKTTYLNGFYVSIGHATTATTPNGQVTVSLNAGGAVHMNFLIAVSQSYPGLVEVTFPDPIPATAANTTIVVTAPSLAAAGIGSITAFGYQL